MDTIPHCQESNGDAHGLDSMRLINIKAFTEREQVMSTGGRVNRRTKIFEFCDDEVTPYAILSHRWIDSTEVDYEEMADLAKMDREEGDEIRQRLGYKKILESCEQAKRDGHAWLWVDTCCIDKRSSAELSEAINSMYRWYENSRVCYAYLHDVWGSSFPTARDDQRYFNFNGWPEWFSRGWTLQEMIAPKDVQFFNKDWQPIADKRTFANILSRITRVPEHVLQHGLSFDRPCVAQILSWAANRTTTRVEDRAYSLLGLLDVNMPMLYGEGKKAFHRLQLEIIRISNDQSVFAWGCRSRDNSRTGSILADDPSFFRGCSSMVLMDHDKFIRELRHNIPEEELPSVEDDQFGTFPITNRGIQIWLFLRPYEGSTSVFQAWLPCCSHPSGAPVTINVALWNSNYYRYSAWLSPCPTEEALHFRQVYFRYQDTYHDVTFAIDDGAIAENGFTCCDVYPSKQLTGNMLTLTGASPLCVRVYSDRESNCRFALTLGQWFGRDFIHCTCKAPTSELLLSEELNTMLVRGPERVQSMAEAPSRGECYGRVWINHTCLLGSTWIVRTSRVVWERSRIGVRMEVFRHPDFRKGPNDWRILEVEVGILLCTHTITIIISRQPVTLVVTYGVSCYAIRHTYVSIHYV